jgi:hypothetical protein
MLEVIGAKQAYKQRSTRNGRRRLTTFGQVENSKCDNVLEKKLDESGNKKRGKVKGGWKGDVITKRQIRENA